MANYRHILANFAIAAASFALILSAAAAIDRLTTEEFSIIISSIIGYVILTRVQRRFFPGRASLIVGVSGLILSGGVASLATAEYIDPGIRSFFFPAFILVILSLGYLAFGLFMARPVGDQSQDN